MKRFLSETWSFFADHASLLLWITLPIVIPVEVFDFAFRHFFLTADSSFLVSLIPGVMYFLTYPIYAAALILYIAAAVGGQPINVISSWKMGLNFWAPFLALMVLITIAVFFGFLLLIIPGLIVAIRLSFATFELVLNGKTPVSSLEDSWKSTRGHAWMLFLGGIVIFGAFYVPYFIFSSLFDQPGMAFWLFASASNVVLAVVGIVYTIFVFRVYYFVKTERNHSLNQDANRAGG